MITIAIDGFSSCGKSTMARHLAREIGYRYIDSGAMYRAVTLYAMRHGMITPDGEVDTASIVKALPDIKIDFSVSTADGTQRTLLNGEDVETQIRQMDVSNNVSPVATIKEVRHALVAMQRELGKSKGIVMDGRDIGTTVFPDAEMKIFVTASPETRAQRRVKELREKGTVVSYEEVLANVVERDHIDQTRAESPLRKADDAIVLDNANLSIDEQNRQLLEIFHSIAKANN